MVWSQKKYLTIILTKIPTTVLMVPLQLNNTLISKIDGNGIWWSILQSALLEPQKEVHMRRWGSFLQSALLASSDGVHGWRSGHIVQSAILEP